MLRLPTGSSSTRTGQAVTCCSIRSSGKEAGHARSSGVAGPTDRVGCPLRSCPPTARPDRGRAPLSENAERDAPPVTAAPSKRAATARTRSAPADDGGEPPSFDGHAHPHRPQHHAARIRSGRGSRSGPPSAPSPAPPRRAGRCGTGRPRSPGSRRDRARGATWAISCAMSLAESRPMSRDGIVTTNLACR